ncbi:uncharacterized protein LOC121423654 [Lytechinus variegatus]|uniref:uncharacterized protein LOC121423654 n=1 Tax=Lytechinus variegatus TaxID=7654 RepID=UPI001BB240B1|nr:uncharacterized protein LOC121423654 [Lytechinus variegatus]XP_041475015.1 uncharacterized protein LOC121423654 [Lytechinus variegatus]
MNGIFLTEGRTQNMADKADKPPSKKSGPVTLIVSAASASQQPSMRIASSIGSVKDPSAMLQSVKTGPGTVFIDISQAKKPAASERKAVNTTAKETYTLQNSPTSHSHRPPSRYKVTPPQRMATRSRKDLLVKEPPKSKKRKSTAKSKPTSKNPKTPNTAVSRSGSASKTVSPRKIFMNKKALNSNQVVTIATAKTHPSNSKLNLQGSSSTVDVTVKCTPSRSLPRLSTSDHHDHSYVNSARDLKELKEMKDLKAKALKNAKVVEKLMKDRRMLRMRNFRANKKIERLKRAVELEQQMHRETRQTLKAVMQGLHLQYPE